MNSRELGTYTALSAMVKVDSDSNWVEPIDFQGQDWNCFLGEKQKMQPVVSGQRHKKAHVIGSAVHLWRGCSGCQSIASALSYLGLAPLLER